MSGGARLSRVLVDGDSSGQRAILCDVAAEFGVELVWVCNLLQAPPEPAEGLNLTVHQVDMNPQAADEKIMNLAGPDCLIVTGDLGLATVCVSRGAAVLGPRGHWFWEERLKERMELRHLFNKQRRAGQKTHGPPGMSSLDDERFERELRAALKGEMKHEDSR